MGSLTSSVRAVDRLRLEAQAADLAVTTLSEIEMGILDATDAGPEAFEAAGLAGWTRQVIVTRLDAAGGPPMRRVEAVIANAERGYVRRQGLLIADRDALPLEPQGGTGFASGGNP